MDALPSCASHRATSVCRGAPPTFPACTADHPTPIISRPISTCARWSRGTHAQLEDRLRLQLCAGISRVVLMDARDEKQRRDTDALEWTLHPWLLSRFLTLLTPLPAPATLANLSAPVDTAYEWAHSVSPDGPSFFLSSGQRRERPRAPPSSLHEIKACVSALSNRPNTSMAGGGGGGGGSGSTDGKEWIALLEAPFESLNVNTLGTTRAPMSLHLPTWARQVRVSLVEFAPPPGGTANALPKRPLVVTATMRSEPWEGCQMEKGAVCVDEADTALFILSAGDTTQGSPDGRHGDASGDDEARVVFLPSSEAGSVQVHRYSDARTSSEPNTMSAEDRSGQRALQACERTQEGRERTVEALAQQLVDGDGYAMLREAISPAEARRLRNHILDALPPHKRTTRVFANHMCQIHKGVPQSPGLDPDCQPLSPLLMTLPTHPAILALARRLLGDGYRLHNAGLSLVSAPEAGTPREALALAHSPHQDLPVNKASVWGGRVPTPSHPLSPRRSGYWTTLRTTTARHT